MLSAEHYALEHRALHQLLQIREREVMHMTDRLNAIGVQSALITGCVVTTFTAITATVSRENRTSRVASRTYAGCNRATR